MSSQRFRVSGIGLLVGAATFIVHIVARSAITAAAGGDTATFAKEGLWVTINALGVMGAALVLLGMPAMYARIAGPIGLLGLVGVVLIALGWMFFGLFLSLFSAIVLPWLADKAPSLVDAINQSAGLIIAFIGGLVAVLVGTVLLAIPFIRGGAQPRWVGYVLVASALMTVVGDFIIAPNGPATNLAVNLLSNLGPVLLMIALGYLGSRMWSR